MMKKQEIVNDLDDAENGNLINTSDEDKTTNEEEKAHSIPAIWHFEKQKIHINASVYIYIFALVGTIAFNRHGFPVFILIFKFAYKWAVSKN